MNNISKLIVAIAATTALTATAANAGTGGGSPTGSVTATATANVITPIVISETTGLNFGTFAVAAAQGGTIDSSGNATGGVNAIAGTGATPAAFATQGFAGNSYSIDTPPNPITLTGGTSGATMPATLTYPSSPRTLSSGGTDSFNVTGVLTVAAGQSADSYSGTYNVSVHY